MRRQAPKHWPREWWDEAKELRRRKLSFQHIANIIGTRHGVTLSLQTVRQWCAGAEKEGE